MEQANNAQMNPKKLYVGGVIVILIAIALILYISSTRKAAVEKDTQDRVAEVSAGPHVRIASVTSSPGVRKLSLQGEARPYASVTLYAKVSGYLKQIKVDKGDQVKEGQIIATIESPETDKSYEAAVADAANKRKKAKRYAELLAKNLVAPQDKDQAEADAEVAEANVASLENQKSYEVLRAPFSGTVTARYADPGALVQNAANSQTSALPVVTISQVNKLRVYVYLDQRDASFIHEGDNVGVIVPEHPGDTIAAHITRYTGELDPKTRTLLAEVELDNPNNKIIAGSFVYVVVSVKAPAGLEVPSEALVLHGPKQFVPVLLNGNTVHFQEVQTGDNDGENVRILAGLQGNERIALSLGNDVAEGQRIQPIVQTVSMH